MKLELISLTTFEANLRRWFLANDLPAGEVMRLYNQWLEFSGDEPNVRGLGLKFELRNEVGVGCAWWEERRLEQGGDAVFPDTVSDWVNMWLTSSGPPDGPMPRPRPYCPPELVGRWQRVGRAEHFSDEPTEVAGELIWEFSSDGRLSTIGNQARDGRPWCIHRVGTESPELYLGDPTLRHVRRMSNEVWSIYRLLGDEMDTSTPGHTDGFLRWRRVRP